MNAPTPIKKNTHKETYDISFGGNELRLTVVYSLDRDNPEIMNAGPEYALAYSRPESCEILHTTEDGQDHLELDAAGIAQLLRLLGKAFPRDGGMGVMLGKRGIGQELI